MTAMDDRDIRFEELRDIVTPIAKRHGVEKIYLFGSRARGTDDGNSDFDFYIVPGRIRTLTKLCSLIRELKEALGKDVDIISEEPYPNEEFSREVFRDRILVYGS